MIDLEAALCAPVRSSVVFSWRAETSLYAIDRCWITGHSAKAWAERFLIFHLPI